MSATTPDHIDGTVRYTVTGWFAKHGSPARARYLGPLDLGPLFAYLDGDEIALDRVGEARTFEPLHLSSVDQVWVWGDGDRLDLVLVNGDYLEVRPHRPRGTASA